MTGLRFLPAIVLSILFSGVAAQAQVVIVSAPEVIITEDRTDDGSAWQILPDHESNEFVDPSEELRRGTTIALQRLVPRALAVVHGDVVRSDDGDRWAEAGDQLFGVQVAGMDVWCVLESKINVTAGMLLLPSATRMIKQDCFIDSDGDGLLDQRFEADPGIGVLPNVARSEPQAFYDLAPVAFSVIDPREFSYEGWVEIEYRGGGNRENRPPRFRVRYRYDDRTRRLTGEARGNGNEYPMVMNILGAQIEIVRDEDDDVRANVVQPMNTTFGVVTSLEY